MSKKQKYPDLTPVTLIRYNSPVEALILFKRGSQYSICNVKAKDVFHSTEANLTAMIEAAAIYNSPLMKALR